MFSILKLTYGCGYMENEILKIARRIQAIAQTGLHYTHDDFDKQRFEELRELSVLLASQVSDAGIDKIREIFTADTGFQTPKIDIRSVVLKDDKVLLTREKIDGKWSLPGGFADINYSPGAVAEKEVFEETGLTVKVNRVLAIVDTDKHNFPPLEYHYYKIIFLCDLTGGTLRGSDETLESGFFGFDELPELSTMRNTEELFTLIRGQLNNKTAYVD
jgi:ADP-ribose pyrophosphatase YjhB (NUDIX family)